MSAPTAAAHSGALAAYEDAPEPGPLASALAATAVPSAVAAPTEPPATSHAATGPGTDHATDDPFTADRTNWWRQDRFGMFIHFGAYSNLEGEYKKPDGSVCKDAEWIQRQCDIPKAEYEKQAATFNPADFDAEAVVKAAKDAGMRYIVITSKHHDGYAMWPTKVDGWNLRDHSSFDKNRDILAELKKASDDAGIKLGFYYSIWDWHDPDFPDPATFPAYEKRMRAQLKELVDDYDPALLWFDGEWDTDKPHNPWTAKDGERLEAYLRDLDPDLIINNRRSCTRAERAGPQVPRSRDLGPPPRGPMAGIFFIGNWAVLIHAQQGRRSAADVRATQVRPSVHAYCRPRE